MLGAQQLSWLTEGLAVSEEHVPFRFAYVPKAVYDIASKGKFAPIVELTLPTSVDRTLAPPGHHIAQLFALLYCHECSRRQR